LKNKSLLRSFINAFNGLKLGLLHERNMKIHLLATVLVIIAGLALGLDAARWAVLVLTISAVIAAELFNTALENVVDMITSQFSQTAKVVKDTAAAAVLVVSIAAAIIGILVFYQPFMLFIEKHF